MSTPGDFFGPFLGATSARKNLLINGGFSIWQRGTGPITSAGFLADRWFVYNAGGSTFSMQRLPTTTVSDDGPRQSPYYMAFTNVTSGGLSTSVCQVFQKIESVRPTANRTVSFSMWVWSSTGKVAVDIQQNFGVGGSTTVTGILAKTFNITPSTWVRIEATVDMPSIVGKTIGTDDYIIVVVYLDAGSSFDSKTGGLGNQTGSFYLNQAQLEIGNAVTPFEIRSPGEELALCQRYYQEVYGTFRLYQSSAAANQYMVPISWYPMRTLPTPTGPTGGTVSNVTTTALGIASESHGSFQTTATAVAATIVNINRMFTLDAEID